MNHNADRRKFAACGVVGAFLATVGWPRTSEARVTGTRPTRLADLAVTSVSSTQMLVSGRLLTLDGRGVSSIRVVVYGVGNSFFSNIGSGWTNAAGSFSLTLSKPPVGQQVQVDIDMTSGAYNPPWPTFARP